MGHFEVSYAFQARAEIDTAATIEQAQNICQEVATAVLDDVMVEDGMNTVSAIAAVKVDENDRPEEDVRIKSITISN